MATSYGITTGTVTKATFNGNSDYLLANWKALTLTAYGTSLDWYPETQNLVEYGTTWKRGLNGIMRTKGKYAISSWRLTMNQNMVDYLEATIFNGVPSKAVTIKTYDQYRNAWEIYNCIATRTRLSSDDEVRSISNEFLVMFRIDFINASIAAAS